MIYECILRIGFRHFPYSLPSELAIDSRSLPISYQKVCNSFQIQSNGITNLRDWLKMEKITLRI